MGTQLLYFTADWCVPCRTYGPLLMRTAEELGLRVVKLNVNEHQDMVEEFEVMSLPTVIVMKEGQVAAILAGALNEKQLRAAITPHA